MVGRGVGWMRGEICLADLFALSFVDLTPGGWLVVDVEMGVRIR